MHTYILYIHIYTLVTWHKNCPKIGDNQQNIYIRPKNRRKKGENREILDTRDFEGGYRVSCL